MPWLGETAEHDTYHRELGEAFGDEGKRGKRFVVGHQTSIASEPGQGPFDHPSPTHDLEGVHVIRAFYDFQLDRLPLERCFELLSSIGAVGEDFSELLMKVSDQGSKLVTYTRTVLACDRTLGG